MAEFQRIVDQSDQKDVQKTPEAAVLSSVIGGQQNQEVHGQAVVNTHANDKTLSEPDMLAIDEGETTAQYKARVAQIQANRFGFFDSTAETGKVIDYKPIQTGMHSYSLGLEYEDERSTRTVYERLADFTKAAAEIAGEPEGRKAYVQGQLDKLIGICEGLNIAKEETKGSVAAGWEALTDGTVANFLSKPNAINNPLFHSVGGVLDAMAKNPNAVNHALDRLGTIIMEGSAHYSALPNREKGHVIGETVFAMVNPEGNPEGGALAVKIGNGVAASIDHTVVRTVQQALKTIEEATKASPELPQQTKQMLYDYIQSKGLTPLQLERGGQIPEGFFDNLERPPEGTAMVGKGGDWPVLNERSSLDVVRQASDDSCVAAVGEMLSQGALKQADLYNGMVTIPEKLADVLGPGWKGGLIPERNIEKAFDIFVGSERPWGAELRDEFYHRVGMGHMVVVDGIDEAGDVMIRDPQHGTRYEMTRETFMKHWSHRAVFGMRPR